MFAEFSPVNTFKGKDSLHLCGTKESLEEERWQSHGLCCVKTEYKQQKSSSGKAVIFWATSVAAKSVVFAMKSSYEF